MASTRFTFNQYQGIGAGYPSAYYVVDSGNSSCVGRVIFDSIQGAWFFNLTEPRYANIGGADAQQILTFIQSLAIPSNYQPIN